MKRDSNRDSSYYPAFVRLEAKRCLVVGGGRVAERKVRALLGCGARVVVVSPRLSRGLTSLKKKGLIEHTRRGFRKGDTRGSLLVFAATSSKAKNKAVAEEVARRLGLVNVVDAPELCSFIVPSIVRRGALCVAVSTSGKSPALSKAIRKFLEEQFRHDMGKVIASLGELRERLKAKDPSSFVRRKRRLTRAAQLALAQSKTGKAKRTRKKCK